MRIQDFVVCCLGVVVVAPTSLGSQGRVRLLRPGTFLIAAPRISASERWFGLRRTDDSWELVPVVPQLTPAEAPCGNQATRITVDATGEMLFLISGISSLTPGAIATAIARPRLLYPGEIVGIGVRATDGYSLEALGTAVHENGGPVLTRYALFIRHARDSQTIATFPRNSPDHPRQVIWAGDLDRDLRPDLLFDFPQGDVGENYELFLSSAAAEGKFVARVASFSTPGC